MLRDSLDYPRRGGDAAKTILIGGVLTAFLWLVVPLLWVTGYAVRVAEAAEDGDTTPPSFSFSMSTTLEGARGVAIGVVYFALPAVVLLATGFASSMTLFGGGAAATPSGPVAVAGVALAALLALPCWYVGGAAFVNFARMGRFGAAFDFHQFTPVLRSRAYARRWLLSVGVMVASGLLTAALELVPFGVGLVLGAIVTFYAAVVATHLYARGFGEARAARAAVDQSTSGTTA
jgi:hypothetical protein